MKFRIRHLHFVLLIFMLVILIAIGVPDTAVANSTPFNSYQFSSELNTDSGVICARENGIDPTMSTATWSLTSMEAAQPYPLPQVNSISDIPTTSLQSGTKPAYLPSIPPIDDKSGEISAINTFNKSEQSINGYNYPAPYTRYENFDSYQVFPYSTIGVLFFTQRGTKYRCSAAVVGEDALWTAGHCVHDGSSEPEGWSENVTFVPAYKNGTEPFAFGHWNDFNLCTRVAWYNNADLRFDIGGVILEPNGSDQSVQEVVGSLGFAYNLSSNQHWFNIAYPSESPFDGKTMQICAGSFARNAASFDFPFPMAMGCDMTPGSSGGAWVINFSSSPGSANYVNGNNSFRISGETEEIYSPYFGDAAKDLLDFISTNTKLSTSIHIPLITHSGDK